MLLYLSRSRSLSFFCSHSLSRSLSLSPSLSLYLSLSLSLYLSTSLFLLLCLILSVPLPLSLWVMSLSYMLCCPSRMIKSVLTPQYISLHTFSPPHHSSISSILFNQLVEQEEHDSQALGSSPFRFESNCLCS